MKKASLLLALIMMLTMLPIGGVAGEEEGHIHPLRMVTCKCVEMVMWALLMYIAHIPYLHILGKHVALGTLDAM